MTSTVNDAAAADTHTRARLLAVSVELFNRHSYEGTSLQMIADELGFTKGAIYHHFRTREDLLHAIVGPLLEQLEDVIDTAEAGRTAHARADHMLTGYAAHLVANRGVAAVLSLDPGVLKVLRANPEWNRLIGRQIALLSGADPGPRGRVKASLVMAGLAAAVDPRVANIDAGELCEVLIEGGRRALGLRSSRGRSATPPQRS
jgi:AcrR family transcriptional regulator